MELFIVNVGVTPKRRNLSFCSSMLRGTMAPVYRDGVLSTLRKMFTLGDLFPCFDAALGLITNADSFALFFFSNCDDVQQENVVFMGLMLLPPDILFS